MVVLAVAIPTLVGSICSVIAASFILVCYCIFPFKPHFRHILVLNLATADFINALNNSISGIYSIARGKIPTGPICTANGFIGQLSVQGTDFSILLIAIITVVVLKSPRFLPDTSVRSQILLTLVVWIVPLTTSTTALALKAYGPVSGNWCWIRANRADLRYSLTHGWRMGIIITTIGLYTYLFFYFRQVFGVKQHLSTTSIKEDDTDHMRNAMANPQQFDGSVQSPLPLNSEYNKRKAADVDPFELSTVSQKQDIEASRKQSENAGSHQALGELMGESSVNEREGDIPPNESNADLPPTYEVVCDMESRDLLAAAWVTKSSSCNGRKQHPTGGCSESAEFDSKADLGVKFGDIASRQPKHATDFASMNKAHNKKVQRALLLNAYPIAYVLLWLPGLINRFVELSTGKPSFVLQVLQSSTQFVGVANAITYGFNERVRRRVRNYFNKRGRR